MAQAEQPKGLLANKNKGKRFTFEGRNLSMDQIVHGEVVAEGEEEAHKKLQHRGIHPLHASRVKSARKKRIAQGDTTVLTRQLVTMMKAGLSLMRVFEIVVCDHPDPPITQILTQVRADVEQDSTLGKSFSEYPKYFDRFYCNLVFAGEAGGILEGLLDRLMIYEEKTRVVKKEVKTTLTYPIAIMVVVVVLIFVMMMFILPAFGEVYSNVGAELPGLTQIVMSMSKFSVKYGWVTIATIILAGFGFHKLCQKSPAFRKRVDNIMLRLPIFSPVVRKAIIVRWSRTMAALFVVGVPLVEVLDPVAGAASNILYEKAAKDTQAEVIQDLSLTSNMQSTEMFPSMITQMVAIGEKSGSSDDMLSKAAEFYEGEVDNSVS